jgi:hypothetical protein
MRERARPDSMVDITSRNLNRLFFNRVITMGVAA